MRSFLRSAGDHCSLRNYICAVNNARLDASYVLQHYALVWMPITEICTLLAVVARVAGVIQIFFRRLRSAKKER